MAKIVTQKDIARRLAISQSHVAGVLAGHPRTGASDETKRRILDTAASLGYVPQATARMLRSGRTYTVSVPYVKPIQQVDSHNYGVAIRIIAEEIGVAGYRLDVMTYPDRETILAKLPSMVRSRACDAVVFWGHDDEVEQQGQLLASLGHPFIARGRHELAHPDWIQVDYDHEGMMRDAVSKVADMGHRRIAYLGHDSSFVFGQHLINGFRTAHRERLGHEAPADWILLSADTPADREELMRRVSTWMDTSVDSRPTALVSGSGAACLPDIEMMLLERGIRIGEGPGHFLVVGDLPQEPMIIGNGWRFTTRDSEPILRLMITHQLLPLLEGRQPDRQIIRYRPAIVPSYQATFHSNIKQLGQMIVLIGGDSDLSI